MKVVQLGAYPPPHGGVQTNIVALHQFLRRHGISCVGINLTRFRRLETSEVYYPKNAVQVLQRLVRLRAQVLHLHVGGNLSRRHLWLGLVCSVLPGTRTVLTFHSGGYPTSTAGRRIGRRSIAGFVLRRFDGVIAVNKEIQQFFRRLGCSEDRIHLISPHAFPVLQDDVVLPSELRDFYSTHCPLLLTIGLLEPEYDLPLQIELLSRIRQAHPGAGLVIIGSGGLETELRSTIDASPDKQHILLAGDVDHAITLRALAECHLFLRTTLYDGDSISVREALHLGKDVIATDNGMRPEGVTIVPISSLPDVEEAVLAQIAARPDGGPATATPDVSNLQSVLDLYRRLVPSQEMR